MGLTLFKYVTVFVWNLILFHLISITNIFFLINKAVNSMPSYKYCS